MKKNIVITNQHCDNRGDESATIGLVLQIYEAFGKNSNITIFRQTQHFTFLPKQYGVREVNMNLTKEFTVQLIVWCICKFFGLDIRGILSDEFRNMITIYEAADVVLSSCGGPYIGDLYMDHELVHIFYTLIPELLGKKVFFSAPSMGPFEGAYRNPIRKLILLRARAIILRDQISYGYVKKLLPRKKEIYLAADLCFAHDIDEKVQVNERQNIIGFTPLAHNYGDATDKRKLQEKYIQQVVKFFDIKMEEDPNLQVEFFPQLYNADSDTGLIKKIQSKLKYKERSFIFSDKLSGVEQQKEIGRLKMMVATRYHSAVFACKMLVPCICIAYEHKAVAMMKSFGLEKCLIDIHDVSTDILLEKYEYVKNNYEALYNMQKERLPQVTGKAKKTVKIIQRFSR